MVDLNFVIIFFVPDMNVVKVLLNSQLINFVIFEACLHRLFSIYLRNTICLVTYIIIFRFLKKFLYFECLEKL